MAEVGCWSWMGEASHDLSLISHHGSASWVWIGGLGSVDGGFETVDLLIVGGSVELIISSSDGGSIDDSFLNGFAPVGFKSAVWVSDQWLGFADRWLGWWVWWPLLALTGLMVCVCVCVLCLIVCF